MRLLLNQIFLALGSRVSYPLTVTLVFGAVVLMFVMWVVNGQIITTLSETVFHATEPATIEHAVATLAWIDRIKQTIGRAGLGGYLAISLDVALFERANKLISKEAEASEKVLA
jgi:hypothetical protein